jgi:hypothetical protein
VPILQTVSCISSDQYIRQLSSNALHLAPHVACSASQPHLDHTTGIWHIMLVSWRCRQRSMRLYSLPFPSLPLPFPPPPCLPHADVAAIHEKSCQLPHIWLSARHVSTPYCDTLLCTSQHSLIKLLINTTHTCTAQHTTLVEVMLGSSMCALKAFTPSQTHQK